MPNADLALVICEVCGEEKPLTLVHLRTGKRGRPPKKNLCVDCIGVTDCFVPGEAPSRELQKGRKENAGVSFIRKIEGFDSAAIFYLGMLPDNLFEPAHSTDDSAYRCKGCRAVIGRREKAEHFETHKRALAVAGI